MALSKIRLINSSRITPQQMIAIVASLIIIVMAFAGLSLVFNVFACACVQSIADVDQMSGVVLTLEDKDKIYLNGLTYNLNLSSS